MFSEIGDVLHMLVMPLAFRSEEDLLILVFRWALHQQLTGHEILAIHLTRDNDLF